MTSVLKSICIVYSTLIRHDFVIKLNFILNFFFFWNYTILRLLITYITFTQFNKVFNFKIEENLWNKQFHVLVTRVFNDNLKFSIRYYDEMDNGRRNICTKCVIDGRLKHHLHTQTTKRTDWHLQLWYLQDLDEHRQDICSFYSKIRCGIELLVMIDGGWPPRT